KPEPDRAGENGAKKRRDENVASAVGDIREDLPGMALAAKRSGTAEAALSLAEAYFNEKPLATPATRKLARDLGLDLRTVRPTGPFGRVTSEDVRVAHAPRPAEARRTGISAPPPSPAFAPPRRASPPPPEPGALEERTPLRGLRKRIFENM